MGMIDISKKTVINRTAEAAGFINLQPGTLRAIREKTVKKGDPFAFAEAAGMLAVKKTPDLIPHCHPIPIESVNFNFEMREDGVSVSCAVVAQARTGVEMEALLGLSLALNTIWDVVKYLEKDGQGQYPDTRITDIRVVRKLKEELQ